MRSPIPTPHPFFVPLVSIVVAALLSTAWAAGPRFGAALAPIGGTPALDLSAAFPFAGFASEQGDVTLAARADLAAALDFATLPSVGASLVADIESHELVTSYVGTGASLGWRTIDGETSSFVAWTVLGGLRYSLGDVWAVKLEAASVLPIAGFALSIGVDLTPWR